MPAPSLVADAPHRASALSTHETLPTPGPPGTARLVDLLYDGFCMIALLKAGQTPDDPEAFRNRVRSFLDAFERAGKRLQVAAADLQASTFAFCALLDEAVLLSKPALRDAWRRRPLQLEYFGDQLAGERFFENLESLRIAGAPKLQVLEVHHMCLLLGFQGRYILEGPEKLGYLKGRLGDEIALLKGRRAPFAPHGAAPDRVSHPLRRDVPAWMIGATFGVVGFVAYLGMHMVLQRQTEAELGAYVQVVRLAPPAAFVTITLP